MTLEPIITKIEEQMADNLYLGVSLALYDKGVWHDLAVGRHTETEPVRPDSIYDVASVSKVLGVGTILAFMLAEGKLELDRAFCHYYPAIKDKTVTLRQLATHTSGVDPYIPNRDQLNREELKEAICRISFTADKTFLYSDLNIILLGFWLEDLYGKSLAEIFQEQIFRPWQMLETRFGPVDNAVPTVKGVTDGCVHDPKAKVLKEHCGSAGLFTSQSDLKRFLEHYLSDDFAQPLWQDFALSNKPRSLVWNLDGDWLDHTGYTGPFIMVNRKAQQAAIILTNRTYAYDDRPLWISRRRELRDVIKETLSAK